MCAVHVMFSGIIVDHSQYCSAHLINSGVTVDATTATIQFTTLGHVTGVTCTLNGLTHTSCKNYMFHTN